MNQFENIMKNPQEAIQKSIDAQKSFSENFNAQHLGLVQKLSTDIQNTVKNTPYDFQSLTGICTEYQKNAIELNVSTFENGFQLWADFAKSFTPKV